MTGLTEAEQAVMKMPGEFFRAFEALPQLHPADLEEVAFHVHALGRIVGLRAAHRASRSRSEQIWDADLGGVPQDDDFIQRGVDGRRKRPRAQNLSRAA